MSEWQTIDTAPKEEKQFLLSDGINICVAHFRLLEDEKCDLLVPNKPEMFDWSDWRNTFQWFPLPNLPGRSIK